MRKIRSKSQRARATFTLPLMLLRRLVLGSRARFSTLTPSRLVPSDWVDLSSKYYACERYTPPSAPASDAVSRIPYHLPDDAEDVPLDQRLRFPEGATGFLYAHTVPGHSPRGRYAYAAYPRPTLARSRTGTTSLS
jgi:hypothetical protein